MNAKAYAEFDTPVLIRYVRNRKKNNQPSGVVCATKTVDGRMIFGWSKCRKGDTFTKREAHLFARQRLRENQINNIPQSMLPDLAHLEDRCARYFKN